MKQNILFVITQFYKGGAEVNLLNIINQLDEESFNVDLLLFDQVDLKSAISLVPFLPKWVNVFNAAENEGVFAWIKKIFFKITRKVTKKQLYRKSAYNFVKDKKYDHAFSYGEWMSPEFVALQVKADKKSVWIHTDIDKAHYIDDEVLFKYDYSYDDYIFVSELSRKSAVKKYPFLFNRSHIIHNILDEKSILEKSQIPTDVKVDDDFILTVGNIRTEKNHLRQIEAMKILKDRGVNFKWLNVGSFGDPILLSRIKSEIKKQGLEEDFLLLGASDNPYNYMREAIAVGNFSNFESWSLVITEARLIGTPVIATRTSGAMEQINHQEDGLITDFTPKDIANNIEYFLKNKDFQKNARKILSDTKKSKNSIEDFKDYLKNIDAEIDTKKIVYLFDNINYPSGVYKNTRLQIKELTRKYNVSVSIYSMVDPDITVRNDLAEVNFIKLRAKGDRRYMNTPFAIVMGSSDFSIMQKIKKIIFAVTTRIGLANKYLKTLSNSFLEMELENYSTVIVLSESSKLRATVSKLKNPQKIQWIHTRYDQWKEHSNWTRSITKDDEKLYSDFDHIVTLSKTCRDGFLKFYPALSDKACIIRNIFDTDGVLKKSAAYPIYTFDPEKLNIITIGRIDKEKALDRIIRISRRLADDKLPFHWNIVGWGVLTEEISAISYKLGLEDYVSFYGHQKNPYTLLKAADVFALFSQYEGSPITIDESMILGKYILSTDVGGIGDQLEKYEFYNLFENTEEAIYENLKEIIKNKENYKNIKSNLDLEYFKKTNSDSIEILADLIGLELKITKKQTV